MQKHVFCSGSLVIAPGLTFLCGCYTCAYISVVFGAEGYKKATD